MPCHLYTPNMLLPTNLHLIWADRVSTSTETPKNVPWRSRSKKLIPNQLVRTKLNCAMKKLFLTSFTIYFPVTIRVKSVEQVNQDSTGSAPMTPKESDTAPPVHHEDADSRDSAPSPGWLYYSDEDENFGNLDVELNGKCSFWIQVSHFPS